ncbi:MAG: glutamyl endopeptidase [Planctomycetota bacterium]
MPDDPGLPQHSFLTPRGLELQQSGRLDIAVPMPLPTYPYPADTPLGRSPDIDPFDFSGIRQAPIHNLVPSKRFPDPAKLASGPLDNYFKTETLGAAAAKAFRAVGKLFIRLESDPRKPLASGSAWIIGPNTIASAAHNFFDSSKRTWSTAVRFYPGFNYYADPQTLPWCEITAVSLPRGYLKNPLTQFDIAIAYTDRNIGDIVDARIPLTPVQSQDFFEDHPVQIIGYPASSGFDFGKRVCRSRGAYLFSHRGGPNRPANPAVATNFGAGASGGPWVWKQPDGQLRAVGVTSGHAKLRYVPGEHPLASLTSPLITDELIADLQDDAVLHEWKSRGPGTRRASIPSTLSPGSPMPSGRVTPQRK